MLHLKWRNPELWRHISGKFLWENCEFFLNLFYKDYCKATKREWVTTDSALCHLTSEYSGECHRFVFREGTCGAQYCRHWEITNMLHKFHVDMRRCVHLNWWSPKHSAPPLSSSLQLLNSAEPDKVPPGKLAAVQDATLAARASLFVQGMCGSSFSSSQLSLNLLRNDTLCRLQSGMLMTSRWGGDISLTTAL